MRKVLNKIKLEIKTQKTPILVNFLCFIILKLKYLLYFHWWSHTVKYSDSSDWLSLTNPNHCCIFIGGHI